MTYHYILCYVFLLEFGETGFAWAVYLERISTCGQSEQANLFVVRAVNPAVFSRLSVVHFEDLSSV